VEPVEPPVVPSVVCAVLVLLVSPPPHAAKVAPNIAARASVKARAATKLLRFVRTIIPVFLSYFFLSCSFLC
jgi:hypothetical protein